MTVAKWLTLAFIASSLVLATQSLSRLFGTDGFFGGWSLAIWALFTALSPLALIGTRGVIRAVISLVLLGLFTDFVLRLVVLSVRPEWFRFDRLVLLDDGSVMRAVFFIALCVLAFRVGLHRSVQDGSKNIVSNSQGFLIRNLWGVVTTAYIVLLVHLVLAVVFNEGIRGVEGGDTAVILRLFPQTGILTIVMFILVKYSKELNRQERAALWSVFILFFVLALIRGQRSAVVTPIILWVITVISLHPVPRIKLSQVSRVGIAALLTLLIIFPLGTSIRDVNIRHEGRITPQLLTERFLVNSRGGVTTAVEGISNRLNEFDKTVMVMGYSPPSGHPLSVATILKASFNNLSIDRIISFDITPPARTFGLLYEHARPESIHGANWSGPGISFVLFGWYSPLVFLVIGFLVKGVLVMLDRSRISDDLTQYLRLVLLLTVFSLFITGSVDTTIPQAISETVLVLMFIGIINRIKGVYESARVVKRYTQQF